MNSLSFRTSLIYRSVITFTLLISIIAACFPDWMNQYGTDFVVLLIVLIGVPHGVADCLIFKYSDHGGCINQKAKFYLSYILLMFVSVLCLYIAPNAAISAFIAISAYHLGQAHLCCLSIPKSKLYRVFIYSCWGAFVIFAPIMANSEAVTEICSQFFNNTWVVDLLKQKYLLPSIIILNLINLGVLIQHHYISRHNCLIEILNLLVLFFLFHTTSLIVSFGVYFTLWHSLSSTLDQIKSIRCHNPTFGFKAFHLQTVPLTLILIFLFIAAQLFFSRFNFYQSNTSLITSLFFGSLAAITLPHALLRDRLYQG
jgi:Brp/Blh family beta-carotene 15,15'-monooxygenase